MYKYQKIIDAISLAEIDCAIKRMADNYDLTGSYLDKADNACNHLYGEKVFKKYFSINSDVSNLIDFYVQKDFEEEKYRLGGDDVPLEDVDFILLDSSTPEQDLKNMLKEKIYHSLLDYLVSKAKPITEDREYLRIPVGSIVDFHECILFNKYKDKVEFYKDGGWGIAEEDGTVIIRNHLLEQPSKSYILYRGNTFYLKIQDRDTSKFGLLSLELFYETIHCLYEEIEVIDYYNDSQRHFLIKAKKDGKWGCFDEKCALVIDFKYDIIQLNREYLECIKDVEYLPYETFEARNDKYTIVGKKDLYNIEGVLLIGGYDNLIVGHNYLQFYFGTYYEEYVEEETDCQGYPCPMSKNRLNYEKSQCLILYKNFKTIISNENGSFKMPIGHVFNSVEEVEKLVPQNLLLRYRVDLSDLDSMFIYLKYDSGVQYIIPDYIVGGFSSPEEMDGEVQDLKKNSLEEIEGKVQDLKKRIAEMQRLFGIDEETISKNLRETDFEPLFTPITYQHYEECYIDDDLVSIIKLSTHGTIDWYSSANEVGRANHRFYYRKNKKIGLFDDNGMHPAIYDAITLDSFDLKTYVASFEYRATISSALLENPNYLQGSRLLIHYFRINDDGTTTCMMDNKEAFNPRKCKWFPYDFINNISGSCDRDTIYAIKGTGP